MAARISAFLSYTFKSYHPIITRTQTRLPTATFTTSSLFRFCTTTHMSMDNSNITTEYVTCFCTVATQQDADKICNQLLSQKLVACVNVIPSIKSSYWWQGKVETEEEILLMMKTRSSLMNKVTDTIKQLHPYDVPEVIFQPIVAGNQKYLDWITESTLESS